MFVDTKTLDQDIVIRSGICIVGSGPAGVALATELLNAGIAVSIIESGGLDKDASDLGQPAKTSVFPDHRGIWTNRQFGGNGVLWHVNAGLGPNHLRLLQMTAADFEARPWIDESGWPISFAEFAPYYDRAQSWFDLEQRSYTPGDWEGAGTSALALEGTGVRTGMFHFAYKNVILESYRAAISASPNVTVYYNATATKLDMDESGKRITGVRATTGLGHELVFEADMFVLAQGGLATPQLLLSSNDRQQNGIGNQHDLVGRYFMDHPLLFGGIFTPAERAMIDRMALYDLRRIDGMSAMGHLQLTDDVLRKEQCVNLSGILFPRRGMGARREAGFQASQRLRAAMQKRGKFHAADLFTAAKGIDGIGRQFYDRLFAPISHLGIGGWSARDTPSEEFDHFEVLHQVEQPPRRDNRIVLGKERDALGNRRIEIHCTWSEADMDMVRKSQQIMAREIRKSGIGEFKVQDPVEVKTSSTTHFMGATRMHDDPTKGVVDSQCRVHGVDNLLISGSSVFPTGGYANPTLSIVAMSIRVADQIKRDFRSSAPNASRAGGTLVTA
jgi:choline dehydrogenase-like flavoprotein